jgi:hypothetical protein
MKISFESFVKEVNHIAQHVWRDPFMRAEPITKRCGADNKWRTGGYGAPELFDDPFIRKERVKEYLAELERGNYETSA